MTPPPSTPTPTTAARPAILIVDDDPDIGVNLTAVLEMEGFEVAVATSGAAAIAALEGQRFAVAIVDITLQHIDGVHIARFLRRHWPQTAIAIFSGGHEADIRARFDDYDAFLGKAQPTEALVAAVRRLAH